MPDLTSAAPATAPAHPPISRSLHGDFIERSIPDWLVDATPERLAAFRDSPTQPPLWYRHATAAQRQALHTQTRAAFTTQTRLDKAMAGLQGIDRFAEPLLVHALKEKFNVTLDVNTTFLQLRQAVEVGVLGIDIASYEVLKLPLLQAALHNFEAAECESGAFHESSGFLEQDTASTFKAITTGISVKQFTSLCRSLDIGAQYQAYLKDYLYSQDAVTRTVLREKFTTAQKAALRAAAEMALLKKDIEPDDYRMLLAVADGERFPRLGGKPVWFCDLSLMKHRMTGCVLFVISDKYRYTDEWILYVPHDPYAPLKRYSASTMDRAFKQRFTERDAKAPDDGSPTPYQRFFSRFVAYADLPDYFRQLAKAAPDPSFSHKVASYAPLLNEIAKGVNPFAIFTGLRHLPPGSPPPRQANPDPFLAPRDIPRAGHGLWADNVDLWDYLFDQHRAKLVADARAHAVPTADVDARVRSEKLARLLNIGMLLFTAVSMFVPVLGELMMGVMAAQLLYESFAGAIEWSEGDRQAAKAHLLDVAQNLAFLAVTAGVGKGLAKLASVKAQPVIENLEPVTLPSGEQRLWKPDLKGYEQAVSLPGDADAQGQFRLNGKTYIRLDGKVYEQAWDETQQRWRIRHPSDPEAYQPLLSHNGAGAWRLALERPQHWDRLTSLRRMGPAVEGLSDETLLRAADISGVDEAALRKMHLDNALPPPALVDALRLFESDRGVEEVIEQLEGAQPINGRYFYSLPLVTQMPRWPLGRVLQVFEGPELAGPSIQYGVERLVGLRQRKPAIRVSRADVLSGELPQRILAQLDEAEITGMLGGEPARVVAARPQELRKQLADFARTRKPAIFDSLYNGTEPHAPWVTRLQRECPGLSEPAAQAVLAQADGEEIARMQASNTVPLHLLQQGRWYAQQGRLARAFAGLSGENMASADSRHLALQTLADLPGWPSTLRLEVREGNMAGTLLDGIGSEAATQRKYLVKRGPTYQAFDERGEALNSVPAYGDNFFPSLMHALPDDARQSLGVAHVGEHARLQRLIRDHALEHRLASARIVTGRLHQQPWFRPPQRIADKLVGYPASGRGAGASPDLTTRVQAVYTRLTDDQANGFILRQMLSGKSERDIVHLLNNRQREWQALESTLDQWTGAQQPSLTGRNLWVLGRGGVADAIKGSWQRAPLAEDPQFARLELFINEPLPPLEADFSHVRHLVVGGAGLTDATVEPLLATFSNVQNLEIRMTSSDLRRVPDALLNLSALTELKITRDISTPAFVDTQVAKLQRLTQLRSLTLQNVMELNQEMDFSGFTQLRYLRVSGGFLSELPAELLRLPHLERVDFKRMSVRSLPPELLTPGHERLWRGLSLDWSRLDPEQFRAAYEYVQAQAEHWVDQEEMVREYCQAELTRLGTRNNMMVDYSRSLARSAALQEAFLVRWTGARSRFQAIEALSAEQAALSADLATWQGPQTYSADHLMRMRAAQAIDNAWYDGLLQRYNAPHYATTLELPALSVLEMPPLPAQGFSHIQTLNLRGLRAPLESLRGFIRGFGQLRNLDLSDCALGELPLAAADQSLLETLDLGKNPLTRLDVSAMDRLQALNLGGSALQALPTGVEQLAQLSWLDLRDSAVTSLAPAALARDELVLSLNLLGAPLDETAQTALTQALQRVERNRGLPEGALARFAAQAESSTEFAPQETATSVARHLLPLAPALPDGEGPLWRTQSLQRLCPDFSADQLRQGLEQLERQGLSQAVMEARLRQWNQTLDALTVELNGWVFVRQTSGEGWQISSQGRALAATRIVECWRQGVPGGYVRPFASLDFSGLQLGDLPGLPGDFSHVQHLDLTGVRITAQGSNDFLQAFTELRRLTLNGQYLPELPRAVSGMPRLEQLDLATLDLTDPEPLYPTLRQLAHLRSLDLGYNNLPAFSVEQLDNLEALDLSHNLLQAWPAGVLQAPRLLTLDLSGNEITSIPAQALDGQHDTLMEGTDLSMNPDLSRESLERLRAYAERRGRDTALGYARDEMGEHSDDDGSDIEQPIAPDEVIEPETVEAIPGQLAPWLAPVPTTDLADYRALWQRLANEPDNVHFFHLLQTLQDTQEFRLFRADLTRRVWSVLEAAERDTELRETLFSMSRTHGTCADGRTLAFSELEVKVFEYNALRDVPPGLEHRGRALLRLSRQLFRLDQVERLAHERARTSHDPAEVRLSYRIGLTHGWRDGLPLPGQPHYMRYSTPIDGEARSQALREVERRETTEAFYDDLIARDYWVRYLEDLYPDQLSALQQRAAQKQNQIEDEHPDISTEAYAQALQALEVERAIERNQKLLELSRQEVAALSAPVSASGMEALPGSSRGSGYRMPRAEGRAISFNGKTYFVASMPDAGDGLHYVLRVAAPNDPQALVSSGILAKPDINGVWRRRGSLGGGLTTPSDDEFASASDRSDDEFEVASESMPAAPYTAEERAAMRRADHFATTRNLPGTYNRVNNGKYPLRDFQGRAMRITQLEKVVEIGGVKYSSDQIKPYIRFGGYEDVARLYDEQLQVRTFTPADMKAPGEQALVGQITVVANRRIAKGEIVGVYGGTVLPAGVEGTEGHTFAMTVGSRREVEGGALVTKPIVQTGDNILSRINTLFEYDAQGKPVRQASEGYNLKNIPFAVEVEMLLGMGPNARTVTKDLLLNTLWASQDIPAGAELRLNYRYTENMVKTLFP
jgi:Leucine-rich repeat (LRR) protein